MLEVGRDDFRAAERGTLDDHAALDAAAAGAGAGDAEGQACRSAEAQARQFAVVREVLRLGSIQRLYVPARALGSAGRAEVVECRIAGKPRIRWDDGVPGAASRRGWHRKSGLPDFREG